MYILDNIPRITIELSNRCNYATWHKLCPTSTYREVKITPLKIIKEIVAELKRVKWGEDKVMAFHVYNEPGIDPRLYWIIDHVTQQLPGIKPYLMTNGWYMNGELMRELIGVGLSKATITMYSKAELTRLKPQIIDLPQVHIHIGNLKEKLLSPGDGPDGYKQCFSPFCDLTIRSPGLIGMCCLDYDNTVTFGDLSKDPLSTILKREESRMGKLNEDLKRRVRTEAVCKLCHRRRAFHG